MFQPAPLYRTHRSLALWTPILVITFMVEVCRWFINPIGSLWDGILVAVCLLALVAVIDACLALRSLRHR